MRFRPLAHSFDWKLLVVVALSVLVSGTVALAQEATPESRSIELPITVDPTTCPAAPMTVEELLTRMGGAPLPATPGTLGAGGTPLPAAPFALPDGAPADPETVAAITATAYDLFACLTSGHWLAVFSLYTDDYLQQLREDVVITQQDIAAWRMGVTPEPLAPEEYMVLLGVREVRVLPDGRVGALLAMDFQDGLGPVSDYVYFVQEEGRWLLDDAVLAVENQYPPVAGTPIP